MRMFKNGTIKFSNRDIFRLRKHFNYISIKKILTFLSNGLFSSSATVSDFFIITLFSIIYPHYPKRN